MRRDIPISILRRKSLGEELTPDEADLFNVWFNDSFEHRLFYKQFCRQQEKVMTRDAQTVNVEEGYSRLEDRLYAHHRTVVWRWVSIAAMIVVLFGTGIFLFFRPANFGNDNLAQHIPGQGGVVLTLGNGERIAIDSVSEFTLLKFRLRGIHLNNGRLAYDKSATDKNKTSKSPNTLIVPRAGTFNLMMADGTNVSLNASSTLRYPSAFSDNERRVNLSGEAYFKVAHSTVPFIVETDVAEVRVYGTEFNVSAYPDDKTVVVTLVNGSVGVRSKSTHNSVEYRLRPGRQFILNRSTGDIEVQDADFYYNLAWRRGLFVSRDDALEDILRKIGRWYDVKFVYADNDLRQKRFNGVLNRKMPLNDLLEIISESGDVGFSQKDRTITVNDGQP